MLTTWILTSAFAVLSIVGGSLGLRLKNLEVPRHADVGTSVLLSCTFELDKNLYSVKWYKDDYEFYRFMPDNSPKSQIFPVTGIHLDTSMSDINNVKLDMVEYKTSGTYKCEVSTEGPAFDTVFRSKNMSVLAYPDRPPTITGHQETYSIGDFITVNCTSGRSNPEPTLAWYINGIKADSYLLDHSSPKVSHAGSDPTAGLLYSRSLGMRTRAEKTMFPGSKATVNLKCTSTVADMPPQYAVVEPRLASASANQKLAQEMSSSSGALNRVSFILLLVIILRMEFST